VILSSNVVVAPGARLKRALVFPDTYIGEEIDIEDAIVDGKKLFRLGLDAGITVTDKEILSDVGALSFERSARVMIQRILGIFLLLLSIPLWPLAAFLSWLESGRVFSERKTFLSNKEVIVKGVSKNKEASYREFQTLFPLLRGLPKLVCVAAGDLCLIGVSPLSPFAADLRKEEWEFVRDATPSGIWGPAQRLPEGTSTQERSMADAIYSLERV
jgi:hypothetical protein